MTIENYLEKHYIHKSNWLRAAVLGANDGILSISSIAIGIASASNSKEQVILAGIAGLVAGALAMASGEYVSVSSQTDIELADIEREKKEIIEDPVLELKILTSIYEKRGLKKETAYLIAKELTEIDVLAAHVRDELGITEENRANPLQAALSSGLSFMSGGILPLIVILLFPLTYLKYVLYLFSIIFLAILGAVSAKTGGTSIKKSMIRIVIWGTISMLVSALVGHLFGVKI
jgi:VIT1/CCC1 family predicted Fe2+/Mn2+ transporter